MNIVTDRSMFVMDYDANFYIIPASRYDEFAAWLEADQPVQSVDNGFRGLQIDSIEDWTFDDASDDAYRYRGDGDGYD